MCPSMMSTNCASLSTNSKWTAQSTCDSQLYKFKRRLLQVVQGGWAWRPSRLMLTKLRFLPQLRSNTKTIPSFETSQNRYSTFVICTRWCSPSWSCSCFWGRTCRWRPLLRPRWRSASGRCPPRPPRRRWTRQGRGGSHPENEDLVSKYNDSISL